MTKRDIKRNIRRLKKLKLQCRAGTPERIKLHRQIKALKEQLKSFDIIEPTKEPIIKEILKLNPILKDLINLNKYSIEQLTFYLDKLKRRRKR